MSGPEFRGVAKLLYNQNPFYLISCGLILYGLQVATAANTDLQQRCYLLAGSMAVYTLLMAATAICVVRWGKVWEDARSIFLVVIIGQVGLSVGFDELCISDWNLAAGLLGCCGAFVFLVTELVLRSCNLQFPAAYRLPYYTILSIFFVAPILAGYCVANEHHALKNWAAPIFSTLIGMGLLSLVPAVRAGKFLLSNNGTPWNWPLYPMSGFVILVAMAGIRSHAMWMSFSTLDGPIAFEPFLLLPVAFAILILMVEADRASATRVLSYASMAIAPMLLIAGTGNRGETFLPILPELSGYAGSAMTVALLSLFCFYGFSWLRGLKGAEFALIATLAAMTILVEIPVMAEQVGLKRWMFALFASAICLGRCLLHPESDAGWLGLTLILAFAILVAGIDYHLQAAGARAAAMVVLIGTMVIGAAFDSELARNLRRFSAVAMIVGGFGLATYSGKIPMTASWLVPAIGFLLALGYAMIVRRTGWFYVAGALGVCAMITLQCNTGIASQLNWPITLGSLCFVIGTGISAVKSGVHQRIWQQVTTRRGPSQGDAFVFQGGL